MHSEVLNTVGNFKNWEKDLFEKEIKLRHVAKHETLLRKGDIATSVFFNWKGLLFQHCKKEENTSIIDLHLENEWVLNHKSFVTRQPADVNLSSLTGGIVLELTIDSIHTLIGHSLSFLQLNKMMDNAVSRIIFFDQAATPIRKISSYIKYQTKAYSGFPLKDDCLLSENYSRNIEQGAGKGG